MSNKTKVDEHLITSLSKLAKLKFDKTSIKKMKLDLNKILEFINAISLIDTEGIKPLVYISEEVNVLREDKVANEVSQKEALKNAPQKDSDYFKVPKVLNK